MSGGASWALQVALKGALTTALAPTPVLDRAPEGTVGTYVLIGDDDAADSQDKTTSAARHLVTIHAWSAAHGGRMAVKLLTDAIEIALDGQPLMIAGFRHVWTWHESSMSILDADGATYHGVASFTVAVEAA